MLQYITFGKSCKQIPPFERDADKFLKRPGTALNRNWQSRSWGSYTCFILSSVVPCRQVCWERIARNTSSLIIVIYHKSWKLPAHFIKKLQHRILWLKDQSNVFAFLFPVMSAYFIHLYTYPVTTQGCLLKHTFLGIWLTMKLETVLFLSLDHSSCRHIKWRSTLWAFFFFADERSRE